MSRVLLADDSPHAQRMGEFILREEGFEIVSVTDGATAVVRLDDVDPDLVLADVSLPQRNGYELCRYIKTHPKHRHVRVVLTAGAQVHIDEEEATRVLCDGRLQKPFEASVMSELAKRLVEEARQSRLSTSAVPVAPGAAEVPAAPVESPGDAATGQPPKVEGPDSAAPPPIAEQVTAAEVGEPAAQAAPADVPEVLTFLTNAVAIPASRPAPDPEAIRAAVTLAVESALPVLIDEITQRVLVALGDEMPVVDARSENAAGQSA